MYMQVLPAHPPPPGMGSLNDMWGTPPPPGYAKFAMDVVSFCAIITFCTLHFALFNFCSRGPPVLIAAGAEKAGESGRLYSCTRAANRNVPQDVSFEETVKEDENGEIRSPGTAPHGVSYKSCGKWEDCIVGFYYPLAQGDYIW